MRSRFTKKETTPTNKECAKDEMTNTNEEEPTMPLASQRLGVSFNDLNMTLPKIGFVQYIHSKVQHHF